MNKLNVSLSPHVKDGNNVRKIMFGVVIALIPAFLLSVYYFGLDAIRIQLLSIATCVITEWLIQKYLIKGEETITDGSAIVTGMLLAFNLPANLPWHIVIIGALVAIGIGKMSFGGLGKNPFNPAIVGRIFMLISFPVQMTSWPTVKILNFRFADGTTGATPLGIMKEGISSGENVSEIMDSMKTPLVNMMTGEIGGSLGEVSAIALIIGGIYLIWKKIIPLHIPLSILGTIVVFSGILNLINPNMYASPIFHLITGGVMLGSIFMATDMATSPMSKKGMIIYGIGIGFITILIRVWGAYPEGISFAILIMNGFVPLINRSIKPKVFGVEKKQKRKK